jgi:hypothetical protein
LTSNCFFIGRDGDLGFQLELKENCDSRDKMKKAMLGILMALLLLGLPASPLSGRAFAQQPEDDGSDEESAAEADRR